MNCAPSPICARWNASCGIAGRVFFDVDDSFCRDSGNTPNTAPSRSVLPAQRFKVEQCKQLIGSFRSHNRHIAAGLPFLAPPVSPAFKIAGAPARACVKPDTA
jgi:hypothetical protein